MVKRVIFYRNIVERDTLKASANALGESTIHDDFVNASGKVTDGTSGKLTFDIKPNPAIPSDKLRERQLIQKLKDDTITDIERNELFKIKFVEE